MNNWTKVITSLMIMMVLLASPSYAEQSSWNIEYPTPVQNNFLIEL